MHSKASQDVSRCYGYRFAVSFYSAVKALCFKSPLEILPKGQMLHYVNSTDRKIYRIFFVI